MQFPLVQYEGMQQPIQMTHLTPQNSSSSKKPSPKKEKKIPDLSKELIETKQKCCSLEEKFYQFLMKKELIEFEMSEMEKRTIKSEEIMNSLVEEVSRLRNQKQEAEQDREAKSPRCPVCLHPFDRNVVPNVGYCGHSVCSLCVNFLQHRNCPICRTVGSFLHPKTNFLAAEFTNSLSFSCNDTPTKAKQVTVLSPEPSEAEWHPLEEEEGQQNGNLITLEEDIDSLEREIEDLEGAEGDWADESSEWADDD